MKNDSLQERIEEPVVLEYARQENKRNWKKLAIYGGIGVGILASTGYIACRYIDSFDISGAFYFVPI